MPAAAAPSEIRKGRKYDQVLAGARTVFLRDGFEGASVDDIAREAGVSKATLYSYFPDKRLLFTEVLSAECLRQTSEAEALITDDMPIEQALRIAAERIVDFALSDFGHAVFCICVSEAERFPGLGQAFYKSGPELVKTRIAAFLSEAAAAGSLKIDDIDLAADQFLSLCKAGLHDRSVLGVLPPDMTTERKRVVDGAVRMFLAGYRA